MTTWSLVIYSVRPGSWCNSFSNVPFSVLSCLECLVSYCNLAQSFSGGPGGDLPGGPAGAVHGAGGGGQGQGGGRDLPGITDCC